MINTRTATLILEKEGKALAASRILFHSRSAGAYLEADLSKNDVIELDDVAQLYYDNGAGEKTLLATTRVFSIPRSDSRTILFASDIYRDKLKTIIPAGAWRKADATEIAESVMADCDIDEFDISALEGIRLPHFSCQNQNGWTVIRSLLRAVNEMEGMRLIILPSFDGMLRVGEYEDLTADYSSLQLDLENMISVGEDKMKAHLVGAVYGQEVFLEGTQMGRIKEAVLMVASDERRTVLWLE